MPGQKKWLIVILIYIDFVKQETFQRRVVNPVLDATFLPEVNSLCKDVLEQDLDDDRTDLYVAFSSVNYSTVQQESKLFLKNSTIICNVVKGEPENTIVVLDAIERPLIHDKKKENVGNYSVQNSEYLRAIFSKIGEKHKDLDERFIKLITWDHGSAFGIFTSEKHPVTSVVEWQDIPQTPEFKHLNKFIEAGKKHIQLNLESTDRFENSQEQLIYVKNRNVYLLEKRNTDPDVFDFLKENITTDIFEIKHKENRHFLNLEKIIKSPAIEKFNTFLESKSISKDNEKVISILSNKEVEIVGFVDILTNEELADAIKNSFKKVDVLVMMNCYMMNLHTMYAMKDVVTFLVAPQGDISKPGYNYTAMLDSLKSISITPEEVASICVTSSFEKKRIEDNIKINGWALFAVRIDNGIVDKLTGIVNEIAQFFIDAIDKDNANKFLLFYSVKQSFNFSFGLNFYMVDLLNWIRSIELTNFNANDGRIIRNLEKRFSAAIREIMTSLLKDESFFRTGDNVYSNHDSFEGITKNPPNGLSIYLPAQLNVNEESYKLFLDTQSKDKSSFIEKNPLWLSLLNKFPFNIKVEPVVG